jgi:hypothetical protein
MSIQTDWRSAPQHPKKLTITITLPAITSMMPGTETLNAKERENKKIRAF